MTAVLVVVGLYGMIGKRNLLKKLIGMNIFQSAIILFFIAGGIREGASVPIFFGGGHGGHGHADPADFMNPLPHVLMLTAIVVSVAITGLALSFLVRIHRRFGTLDETELLKRMEEKS